MLFELRRGVGQNALLTDRETVALEPAQPRSGFGPEHVDAAAAVENETGVSPLVVTGPHAEAAVYPTRGKSNERGGLRRRASCENEEASEAAARITMGCRAG
jgi:hypothetical protein